MKVETKKPETVFRFEDIKQGDIFSENAFHSSLYIKTSCFFGPSSERTFVNSVNLITGNLASFNRSSIVIPVNGKVVIE